MLDSNTSTDTSMTLAGVYSGLKMNMTGSSGTVTIAAAATARTGYKISSASTTEGKIYSIVAVDSESDVTDPPSIVITTDYVQQIEIAEVDLDVKYTNIPAGTSLQIECSETTFNIAKQEISGSSLIGSSGKTLGPFNASIALKLWITNPDSIVKSSGLTMSLSKIVGGTGKPVKKVLLEKIQANLSN